LRSDAVDLQASLFQQMLQAVPRETEIIVGFLVETPVLRRTQDQAPPRFQDARRLDEHRRRVGDMLEDLRREYRVEDAIAERKTADGSHHTGPAAVAIDIVADVLDVYGQ
jgi:hypothetical protein